MDLPIEKKWFSGIPPPVAGLSDSVDYLDRMIAGSKPQPIRYNAHKRKHNNKNKGHTNQTNRRPNLVSQASKTVEIDDATWLADRRKKFPKVGSEPSRMESPKPNPKSTPNNRLKTEPKKERRKTLFEKLVEA